MLFETKSALEARAAIYRNAARGPWMRLLGQVFKLAEGHADLLRHGERAWASATFAGTRHTIALSFEGAMAVAAGERLIAALPDHEFNVPGHLVADATISAVDHTLLPAPRLVVEIEVLLLEDL
jgi:hypothetical protein